MDTASLCARVARQSTRESDAGIHMTVYVYIYMYICIYICKCIYMYIYVYTCICVGALDSDLYV